MKGTYCLIIENKKKTNIKIGALGKIEFEKGYYVYIGSAMNSLIPRLKRHLSSSKKTRWHIDYLLKNRNTEIVEILFTDSLKRIECLLTDKISKNNLKIDNFGCSDCDCLSHLIYFETKENSINSVKDAYNSLNINFYDLDYFISIV